MALAAAGGAVLFAAIALFFFLEQPIGRGPAALTVAALLGLAAAVLWRAQAKPKQRPANGEARRTAAQAGGPASPPPSGEAIGPAEAVAVARWVVRERPLLALGVCLGAGYVLVRHPKAVGSAVAALSSLAASRLAPKA